MTPTPYANAGPAGDAVSITTSDSTVYDPPLRSLYVGTTGNVAVRTRGGTTITFTSVPVGMFPVQCDKVLSTGTTASGLIGLY